MGGCLVDLTVMARLDKSFNVSGQAWPGEQCADVVQSAVNANMARICSRVHLRDDVMTQCAVIWDDCEGGLIWLAVGPQTVRESVVLGEVRVGEVFVTAVACLDAGCEAVGVLLTCHDCEFEDCLVGVAGYGICHIESAR